jgi:hypothetical protein
LFRAIIDQIGAGEEFLICDDLGDEWADFIGINFSSNPKSISFYLRKQGHPALGASALHVIVSQAIKNLGRMNFLDDDIAAKLRKWQSTYNNANAQTLIPRILRGNPAMLRDRINEVIASPDSIRRVFIVTSSLSKRDLEQSFDRMHQGHAPEAYSVQLYWLLRSFFGACDEVGAFPCVVCGD